MRREKEESERKKGERRRREESAAALRGPTQVQAIARGRQYAAHNKIIPERGREREGDRVSEGGREGGSSTPLTTMRHFIINPPVAPPPYARPQSEIQIKHANICVFYSRGFVAAGRVLLPARAARAEFNSFCYKYISGRGKLPFTSAARTGEERERQREGGEGRGKKCTRARKTSRDGITAVIDFSAKLSEWWRIIQKFVPIVSEMRPLFNAAPVKIVKISAGIARTSTCNVNFVSTKKNPCVFLLNRDRKWYAIAQMKADTH